MNTRLNELQAIPIALTILMVAGLSACQTDRAPRHTFPTEQRFTLQPGGPHEGTAETLTVMLSYRYSIQSDKAPRSMLIGGSLNRFKMKPDSMTLHIHFLDDQGETLEQKLIYALGNHHGRDTFIRPSSTFKKTLQVPDEAVYFAFNSRTRLSRGRK